MGKFNRSTPPVRVALTAPLATTGVAAETITHEGGAAYRLDAVSELVVTAATTFSGESTFYEGAAERDKRLRQLAAAATQTNPESVASFAGYLRSRLLIRSAAIVVAAEYVAAGGPRARSVVSSVLQRADEPAEMLAYWHARHGRRLPAPVKRGVADAAARLYTERSVLRHDSRSSPLRMADVIELTHPRPRDERQGALFAWLLDNRHHGDGDAAQRGLAVLAAHDALQAIPAEGRRAHLRSAGATALADAGMSWERIAAWLPGGMDAEAWEDAIEVMAPMALLRNLRNFDEAGISGAAQQKVVDRITDADRLTAARIFPHHAWVAYVNAPGDTYKVALGAVLEQSTANIPALDRTLVLVDTSASMRNPLSHRSKVLRIHVAATTAAALAHRSSADIAIFASSWRTVEVPRGEAALATTRRIVDAVGSVGHGTLGHAAIAGLYDPTRHDRVLLLTDDQMADSGRVNIDHVPLIYTVDLSGYAPRSEQSGSDGRYLIAGYSDAMFATINMLESGRDAAWPWDTATTGDAPRTTEPPSPQRAHGATRAASYTPPLHHANPCPAGTNPASVSTGGLP